MVSVLLATYNGAEFLDEQLASIETQTYAHIDIWVSDDGSSDTTLQLLEAWRLKWAKGKFTVLPGPRKGFAENFRALITNPDIISDYYAFADQDDIWEPEKLAISVRWIAQHAPAKPALFGSRTLAITQDGAVLGPSPLFARPPSFENALVQSLAGGNTMLYNRTAQQILAKASGRTKFVSHDWWIYLIVAGAGGTVHYSPEMTVRYRQHVNNQVGSNIGMQARLRRIRLLFSGRFVQWTELNIEGLLANQDLLTDQARRSFQVFRKVRANNVFTRVYNLVKSGVYRQTILGQIGLYVAALTRRI
ncbi:glycosyltransferase family 2 protein [Phyllobacterium sp. 628]|nr:glycosyltransferase family 2 protein [Phyllobacterium sp. 628]